jgi:NAD(P)-dependent dehydrogenase (short-subunit alcohol dehydrogenase family)
VFAGGAQGDDAAPRGAHRQRRFHRRHDLRTAQIAYCSAKAAVIHFTRCLAVEVAPHGITVNCLCPGMTRTDMLSRSAVERGLDLDAMMDMPR